MRFVFGGRGYPAGCSARFPSSRSPRAARHGCDARRNPAAGTAEAPRATRESLGERETRENDIALKKNNKKVAVKRYNLGKGEGGRTAGTTARSRCRKNCTQIKESVMQHGGQVSSLSPNCPSACFLSGCHRIGAPRLQQLFGLGWGASNGVKPLAASGPKRPRWVRSPPQLSDPAESEHSLLVSKNILGSLESSHQTQEKARYVKGSLAVISAPLSENSFCLLHGGRRRRRRRPCSLSQHRTPRPHPSEPGKGRGCELTPSAAPGTRSKV